MFYKTGCQAVLCMGSGVMEVLLIMSLLLLIIEEGSPSPNLTHSTLQLENFHFYIIYILNIGLWTRFSLRELNIPWLETWKLYSYNHWIWSLKRVQDHFKKFKEIVIPGDHQLDYKSFKVIFAGKRGKKNMMSNLNDV